MSKPVLNAQGRSLRQRLGYWLERQAVPESGIIMFTSVIVGAGAGLVAVGFRWLIEGVSLLAYGRFGGLLDTIVPLQLLIIPALGGAIIGPIIYFLARETKGAGIPEVMEAVALRGGRIRPRVIAIKALVASICIGTGGSVGREGPIVQIGSALGSTVGQMLNLSDERIRSLVASGAAGGIAATFNAPIAGSIFALEVILGQFNALYFGSVVISAVTADVVAHIFEGNQRAFSVPPYTLISPWELLLYTLLGVLAAFVSVGFMRLLSFSEDWWSRLGLPDYLKPVLGGLLLGGMGLLTFKADGFPRIFGVGYNTIDEVLFGRLAIQISLILLFLKMAATVLTLGSGGSGGIFAPSLFMGAMLGDAFGQIAHQLFPNITAPSGAYALVGMAALVSGTTHTPVTSILILFEMTGDYRIILPLMLATVISTLISRSLSRDSVYTLKLSRRGIRLGQGQDIDVMQGVTVGEAMSTELRAVPGDMSLTQLADHFARWHHHGLPVVDEVGNLVGAVSLQDLERALTTGSLGEGCVADIATMEGLLVAYPDEPMGEALRRLGQRDVSLLPVLEREGTRRLVGVVRRRNIIRAYNHALIKRAQHQHQVKTLSLGNLDDASFIHINLPDHSPVIGQRLSEIKLPEACLIVSVRRGRRLRVAHGHTILQGGDQVTIFADDRQHLPLLRKRLTGTAAGEVTPHVQRARHLEITLPAGVICSGKMVRELVFPPNCILVSIQRGSEVIIPHGDTMLRAGDVVEIFGVENELDQAQTYLLQE